MSKESNEQRRWYRSAGLSIVSSIPLDELATPAPPGEPELVIETMSRRKADAFAVGTRHALTLGETGAPWLEIRRGPDGYLARWPGQLDVAIPDDGRRMLVHQRGHVEDSIARLLLCQAMSFVLPRHGREGLHASAVEIDGRAVVISGDAGRGKSTLATALCLQGARLVSDDLVSIRIDSDGAPVVDPSTTKTWLAGELAELMVGNGFDDIGRPHKVAVGGDGIAAASEPLRVSAVYLLGWRGGAVDFSEPLGVKEALAAFLGTLFNFEVDGIDRRRLQFDIATKVAETVPIRALRWEANPDNARAAAEEIMRAARAISGGETMTEIVEKQASVEGNGKKNGSQRERIMELLRAAGVEHLPDDTYDEPLLRTSQVAALLRSSDRTIRTWADAGKLPYIKTLGGRRLFPVSAVLKVMQSMRSTKEA